jgi:cation transport ATPase
VTPATDEATAKHSKSHRRTQKHTARRVIEEHRETHRKKSHRRTQRNTARRATEEHRETQQEEPQKNTEKHSKKKSCCVLLCFSVALLAVFLCGRLSCVFLWPFGLCSLWLSMPGEVDYCPPLF